MKKIGEAAGLIVTPAHLRATWLATLTCNTDATTLANMAGYESLEAARRLLRPARAYV